MISASAPAGRDRRTAVPGLPDRAVIDPGRGPAAAPQPSPPVAGSPGTIASLTP